MRNKELFKYCAQLLPDSKSPSQQWNNPMCGKKGALHSACMFFYAGTKESLLAMVLTL
jgi:hypothetical protein